MALTVILVSCANAIESEEGTKIFEIPLVGGLNNQYNPFMLKKGEADVVKNIRFDSTYGTLTKRDKTSIYGTASATEPITGMHRLYQADGTKTLLVNYASTIAKGNDTTGAFTTIGTVSSADHKWQWLTWNDRAIGCDGYNNCVKYDGADDSLTYLGSLFAISSSDTGNPNGSYNYKVACYSSTKTATFNVASNAITVSSRKINLSEIPICPDSILGEVIAGRKVYRTASGGGTYKLLSNGTIADNNTTTLIDNDADGSLGAAYPTGDEILTPPNGKLNAISNDRLWIANNPANPSRVYYSEIGLYDVFYDDSYFDIRASDGDQITFLKNILGILTVGKNNSIQKIYNDDADPDNWDYSDPFSFVGNQAMYSAVNTQDGLFYLGNNGIYLFNGQYSTLISDKVTPTIRDIKTSDYINVWGAYFNNTYYMTYTSNQSSASYNNRILTYDVVSKSFNIDYLNANVLHTLNSGTDVEVLYSGSSVDGKIRQHSDSGKQIVHTAHSDFIGTADDVRYIPVEAGGDADSAIFEISWTETIDEIVGTIDSMSGIIDRPDTNGTYWSQPMNFDVTTYDKIYWNEMMPSAGGSISFYIRSATSDTALATAPWSSAFTSSTGSDISDVTPNSWTQYKFDISTNDITQTPNIYEADNYVVKLTYSLTGASDETSIPIDWRTGWMDFQPGYKKTLKKLIMYYDSVGQGTLTVNWVDYDGASDSFAINLQQYPSKYEEYFTSGALLGDVYRMEIMEDSLNALKIKKIVVVADIEPLI